MYNCEQILHQSAAIIWNSPKQFSQNLTNQIYLLDYLFSSNSICYYKLNKLIHFEKHLLFKHYLLLFSLSVKQEKHISIIKLKFCDSQSLVFHSSNFTKVTYIIENKTSFYTRQLFLGLICVLLYFDSTVKTATCEPNSPNLSNQNLNMCRILNFMQSTKIT
jgi:hypothetical protein